MQPNIYRKKLLNAVLFFAKNTKYTSMSKILKLLYFLDFKHFKQTGYPSIGLKYDAFRKGPVPRSFWLEIKDGNVPEDFKDKLALLIKRDDLDQRSKEIEFRNIVDPDLSIFTQREKEILDNLAFVFKEARAWEMSEVTHLKNEPWDRTIKKCGENRPIDYILAIDREAEISLDDAKESVKEHFEAVNNLYLDPTK